MSRSVERDLGWKKIKSDLRKIDNSFTKVGVHAGTKREDDKRVSMVEIASANEFGTKRIPQRPFLRSAFDMNKSKLNEVNSKLVDDIYLRRKSLKAGLSTLGEVFTRMVQTRIKTLRTPANAVLTIKIKKSSNPLIDKGQLRQSITHVETLSL